MQGNYREIKVVFLGDGGVGKTSILHRFHINQFKTTSPTIGASFVTRNVTVGNSIISFQIWDTAGQEKYRSIASLYYKDAAVAILVYDITNRNSYEVLKYWRKQLVENGPENLITVIVGNKIDLVESESVNYEEAKAYANSINAIFKLTSAKDNKNILELFNQIAEQFANGPSNPADRMNLTGQPQFQSAIDPRAPNQFQPNFYSQGAYQSPNNNNFGMADNLQGKPNYNQPTQANQNVRLDQNAGNNKKEPKGGYFSCC